MEIRSTRISKCCTHVDKEEKEEEKEEDDDKFEIDNKV